MAGSAQRDTKALTVTRQPDGRHSITDALGNVLGIHNSPVSAARQLSLYFGHPTAEPMEQNAGIPAQHLAQQQQAMNQAMGQAAARQQMQTAMLPNPKMVGTPPVSATQQLAAQAQMMGNQAAMGHQNPTFHLANGGQTATGVSPQQAADVALVQQRTGPNAPPASAAAQQAAYNAFHPGR